VSSGVVRRFAVVTLFRNQETNKDQIAEITQLSSSRPSRPIAKNSGKERLKVDNGNGWF
jgi:hypothetical protein